MSDTPEKCPDCGRIKARSAKDEIDGLCPKWYSLHDKDAADDCLHYKAYALPIQLQRDALKAELAEANRWKIPVAEAMFKLTTTIQSGEELAIPELWERALKKADAELAAVRTVLVEVEKYGPSLPLGTYLAACRLANAARKP